LKTYKTTVEKPRLAIKYDTEAESPRKTINNIGYFITIEDRHYSPDENAVLTQIINVAEEVSSNLEDHMEEICFLIKERLNEKVVYIKPITRFDHREIKYLLGKYDGFDHSLCGFYIVTNKTLKKYKVKKEEIETIVQEELNYYNAWVNKNIYCYKLYDKKGNIEQNVVGIYNFEHIYYYLPSEWQDEELTEYFEDCE